MRFVEDQMSLDHLRIMLLCREQKRSLFVLALCNLCLNKQSAMSRYSGNGHKADTLRVLQMERVCFEGVSV